MALINEVKQRVRLNRRDIIRCQLLHYSFLKSIYIADGEMHCIAVLAQNGRQELSQACKLLEDEKVYASAQAARNSIQRLEGKGLLFIEEGDKQLEVWVNPEIQLVTSGNIVLDYKFGCSDSD